MAVLTAKMQMECGGRWARGVEKALGGKREKQE